MTAAAVFALLLGAHAGALRLQDAAEPLSDFDIGCYETSDKGLSYKGLTTSTESGRTCQNWSKQKPHAISIEPTPDNGLGNHNYCRNPDDSEEKPWCYTQDSNPEHEKEVCSIPACPGMKRDFNDEAATIATKVGSHDCECAAQLYGSTTTTADTTVSLLKANSTMVKGRIVDGKCHCPVRSRLFK